MATEIPISDWVRDNLHHLNLLLNLRKQELRAVEIMLAESKSEKWRRIRTDKAARIRARVADLEARIRALAGEADLLFPEPAEK